MAEPVTNGLSVMPSVVTYTVLLFIAVPLWRFWKHCISKVQHLAWIAGPPNKDIFMGTVVRSQQQIISHCASGNLGQLYAASAGRFLDELDSMYSSIVKIHGFIGVKASDIHYFMELFNAFQDTQLYIYDPHAVSAMLSNADIFEPTDLFLQYVLLFHDCRWNLIVVRCSYSEAIR